MAPKPPTDRKPPSRFWRICRTGFRWFRIACLLLLLALVCAVIYVNRVGLPGFIKNPLQAELRHRGVELQFERMRWRWFRGVVAENVTLGRARTTNSPQLFAREVTLRVNDAALRRLEFQVDALVLEGGDVRLPLLATNGPRREFTATDIQTEVRFLPGDQWELTQFEALSQGLQIHVQAVITNASALRRPTRAPTDTNEVAAIPGWHRTMREVLQVLDRVQYTGSPELFLRVQADARRTNAFEADLKFTAPAMRTPWGRAENILLTLPVQGDAGTNGVLSTEIQVNLDQVVSDWVQARQVRGTLTLVRAWTNRLPVRVDANLRLRDARSRWASAQGVAVDLHTRPAGGIPGTWQTTLEAVGEQVQSAWVQATQARVQAEVTHGLTHRPPERAHVEARLRDPASRWGGAEEATLALGLITLPEGGPRPDAALGWWTNLAPYQLDWKLNATRPRSVTPRLESADLEFQGRWRLPELVVEKVAAPLYGGRLDATGRLDVVTREAQANVKLDFDVFQAAHVLRTNTQRWLQQFEFQSPPRVSATARVTLPAWTTPLTNWHGRDFQPSLVLDGRLEAGGGAYRGLAFTAATSDFSLSNTVWRMPNLHARRPEGEVRVDYWSDTETRDYRWEIAHLAIDPRAVRPVLDEAQQRGLDQVTFTEPPVLRGRIEGRWNARERTRLDLHVAATNFSFKGETVASLEADARYADAWVYLDQIRIAHETGIVTGEHARIDVEGERMYVTNVFSTADPYRATGLMGPKTARAITPYKFATPPTVHLNGSFPFRESKTSDLHFQIGGGPFAWSKFNVPAITGVVHWVTNTLTVTNLSADFYGGRLGGAAWFDFSPKDGADFNFHMVALNSRLQSLMTDITGKPSKLEGDIDIDLGITSATTEDWKSWQGFGTAKLRDGYLWDIPLFGIFTKLFDSIQPGLGSSRVSEAKATYIITNSVIFTRDMELRSLAMRLQYDGTVDFDTQVNARVQAELFRDTAKGLFSIVSFALMPITKLFEYKVTGTLADPKKEPLYIPKFLMMPLHPLRTLKDWFEPGGKEAEKDPVFPPVKEP